MAKAVYYPRANRSAQWWDTKFDRKTFTGIDKLLLHTTETGSWPGYSGGKSAPTLTYDPTTRQWRQHNKLNRSARALRDPSGTVVRENQDNVVQVEINCSCDKNFAKKHGYPYAGALSNAALDDLGAFAAFLHIEWGLPLVAAPLWLPYPESYGNSRARMSGPRYDAFKGILGHQHASGNDHGDPGSLNVGRILSTARQIVSPMHQGADVELEMKFTDKIPNAKDPDGSPVTVGEALARGNWAYFQLVEGGAMDKRMDKEEAEK